jgi:hypothetical protein
LNRTGLICVPIMANPWGEWQDNHGPRENNSDWKPNHEMISKEILEAEPYQLLQTLTQ